MIKQNFVIICDNAYMDKNQRLNIEGVFDSIFAKDFPAVHKTLFIVSNFDIVPDKYTEHFVITGPDRSKFVSEEYSVDVKKEKHQFVQRLNNLELKAAGKYTVEIFINGDCVGSNYFYAKKID